LCLLAFIVLFSQTTSAEVSQQDGVSPLNVQDPYSKAKTPKQPKPKTPKTPKTPKMPKAPHTPKVKPVKPAHNTTKPVKPHVPPTVKPKPIPFPPAHGGPTPVSSSRCSGVCQDNSLDCDGDYLSGLCPGASNIQCCPSSGDDSSDGGSSQNSGSLTLDQDGIDLIKGFEGWSSCYYKDVAGYGTIGFGHLVKSGDPYGPGTCISEQDGENLLASDAQSFVNCVNAMGVQLNQHQFDALVSFSYNLGCGDLSSVKSLLQAGNYGAVCAKIEQYTHAGGQVVQGLVNRRKAECNLFNS